jgi:DNA replication protein DnaD
LVPGVSCTITTEDASKVDTNNCSVFTNTKKLSSCTKYTCELCKHETIYSGERKPIKQKVVAPIKILETKIQPIAKIPETKELKSMAIGTPSKQSKKKKKQETKENASVSDFLNKLGI